MENLTTLTGFNIREGLLPDKLFLDDEEVGVIARKSFRFYQGQFLTYIREEISRAAWAAQMVLPCAQGNEAMCRLVEDMLGKKPKKGSRKWYLEQAYREIVRGDLSPKGFLKVYHGIARASKYYKKGELEEKIEKRKDERL